MPRSPRRQPVVGRVLVDRLVRDDLEVLGLRRALDVGGQAGAVDLLVVGHLHLGAAVLLHDRRERRALDRVFGDDARVGALARGVVLVGLSGGRARLVRGQPDGRVGGADLRDARLVEDRDRERRGAGVELADVDRRGVVLSRLAGVGRRRLRRPRPGLGGRVVERLVLDREVAGLAAGLLERQLDPLHHVGRLRPLRALQRQRRVHRQGAGLALAFRPAGLVVATRPHGQGDDQHRRARSQHRISFRAVAAATVAVRRRARAWTS